MIRPNEAPGLTAALARSIDAKAADLTRLLADDAYHVELQRRGLTRQAHQAFDRLCDAERALRAIANALAAPAEEAAAAREAKP